MVKKKRGKPLLKYFLALICLGFISAGIIYAWQKPTNKPKQISTNTNSNQNTNNLKEAFLPTEKIYFSYPSDWTLNIEHYTYKGIEGDTATITGSDNYQITIQTGNYDKGDYDSCSEKECNIFAKERISVSGNSALMLVTGSSSNGNGAQMLTLSTKDERCSINCRMESKNSSGYISASAGYFDNKSGLFINYDPQEFIKDSKTSTAKDIFKSLHY